MKILLLSGLAAMSVLLTGCGVTVVDRHPVHRSYGYYGDGYYGGPRYYNDRPSYYSSGYYHSRPAYRNVYASNSNVYRTNVSRTNVNVYKRKNVAPVHVRKHVKHKRDWRDRD